MEIKKMKEIDMKGNTATKKEQDVLMQENAAVASIKELTIAYS